MAQNDVLLAQYPTQEVVRKRNYAALVNWAFGTSGIPLPTTKPDVEFVRNRLVALRIPQQIDSYVQRTLPYFLQASNTQVNIRQFMNAFNDDTTETALSGQNLDIIAGFMPAFAQQDVSEAQVQEWYENNGFGTVEPEPQIRRG